MLRGVRLRHQARMRMRARAFGLNMLPLHLDLSAVWCKVDSTQLEPDHR